MNSETVLIFVLSILVATLLALLIARGRQEKRKTEAIRATDISRFPEILRNSGREEDLQSIVDDTANLLVRSFGCDRLCYFIREGEELRESMRYKPERVSHGGNRIIITDTLLELLRSPDAPVSLKHPGLQKNVPQALYDRLVAERYQLLLPIWRGGRLYGLLITGRSTETGSSGLSLLLTGLAQALEGGVKVSETGEPLATVDSESVQTGETISSIPRGMIDLIEHHEPHTLVERMIETVRDHLRLERFAYVYETCGAETPLRVIQSATDLPLSSPSFEEFRRLAAHVDMQGEGQVVTTRQAAGRFGSVAGGRDDTEFAGTWLREWIESGFRYLASFPPSTDRAGILAWDGAQPALEVARSLRHLNETGTILVRNAESFQRIEELSYTDNLTGVANQRYFLRRLHEEIERAGRYGRSLGLIIFDLDELKQINDSYGHLAGDRVIKRMGAKLSASVRAIDVIARYGGDEFCVIMPEADAATCRRSMSRLVQSVSSSRFDVGQGGIAVSTTVSAGGALYPEHASDSEGLIYAADMALLRAKEGGRNRSLLYKAN